MILGEIAGFLESSKWLILYLTTYLNKKSKKSPDFWVFSLKSSIN
jgi:lipid-A-disaccharide synthase-like uncharacterized protein